MEIKQDIINLEGEIWKDIKNYEGIYQVSNLGRIKRLKRKSIYNKNIIYTEKIKKNYINDAEYHYINLIKNKEKKSFSIHRLVAIHFILNTDNLPIVHHKDHNPQNNKVDNLMWVSNAENSELSRKEGRLKRNYLKKERNIRPPFKQEILPDYYTNIDIKLENEIWLDAKGFEEYYKISNYGRVFSLQLNNLIKPHFFGSKPIRNGRPLSIGLWKNGVSKNRTINQLVAEYFIPNINNLPQVNHINGNKTDNHISNLEWITARDNQYHAMKIGLKLDFGENNMCAKLTEKEVLEIRNLYLQKESKRQLSKKYLVSEQTIRSIINRITWKHI